MATTEPVTVFINEKLFRVRPGLSAVEAVALLDPAVPDALSRGAAYLTDARGIRLPSDTPVHDGTIIRVIRRRPDTSSAEPPSRPC